MDLITTALTTVLALLTIILTYQTVRLSSKGVSGQVRPAIAISIKSLKMGSKFNDGKRQSFSVLVELKNIGNAAAIFVSADSEIVLKYKTVSGGTTIPQRFPPEILSTLSVNEHFPIDFSFGNLACAALLADCREQDRLNRKRIEENPTQEPHGGPRIRVTVHYRDLHNDELVSRFECRFGPYRSEDDGAGNTHFAGWGTPDEDEDIEFSLLRDNEMKFSVRSISKVQLKKEIEAREARRKFSGW